MSLIAARSAGRHRSKTARELRAENAQLNRYLADRERKYAELDADFTELGTAYNSLRTAFDAAARRIADLEEAARVAADLNARSLHVPPAEPVELNDATQPMDCHTLRAEVGTSDNPRTRWAKPVVPVIPLHGAFGPANPGPVDGDTTLTIPIPNAA